jgi:hypothetical protein
LERAYQSKIEVYATGINPTHHIGNEYVSEKNCWLPIWMYVTTLCEDLLIDKELPIGYYNKELSNTISQENSIKIANRILEEIQNGRANAFGEKTFGEDTLIKFCLNDLENFANFCGLSGGFLLT